MKELGTREWIKLITSTGAVFITALIAMAAQYKDTPISVWVHQVLPILGASGVALSHINSWVDQTMANAKKKFDELEKAKVDNVG